MQTKLPLFVAAIFGSLTTLAWVQLLAEPQTVVPASADVRSASLSSVVDCAPTTTAAGDVTNSATVSTPNHQRLVAAAVVQATSDNSAVSQPAEAKQVKVISNAQQHQQLVQQLIVPHVTNLAMVLQLPAGQQQQIQALLQEKADADFANWQQVQQQLQAGSPDGAELASQFQQQVQQSSAQYAAQLRNTLSASQFEQYTQYENTLLNMRKQQQVNQLQSRLAQISNLDEFQRQEISRLAAIAFKTPSEIQLGAVASPYAPSLIETDPDALQQLRSVLTESQRKESGWQE